MQLNCISFWNESGEQFFAGALKFDSEKKKLCHQKLAGHIVSLVSNSTDSFWVRSQLVFVSHFQNNTAMPP